MDKSYEVYSECLTPELEFIELGLRKRVLGKEPDKLGISLYVGEESVDTLLTKPDLVMMKRNKVQHIIDIEESKNPMEFAGLIVASRLAELCVVSSSKLMNTHFEVRNSILHILYRGWLTDNVKAVINNVINDKGNLLEIRIMQFDEFMDEMDGF